MQELPAVYRAVCQSEVNCRSSWALHTLYASSYESFFCFVAAVAGCETATTLAAVKMMTTDFSIASSPVIEACNSDASASQFFDLDQGSFTQRFLYRAEPAGLT